ncbi:MAG: hypothetical protein JXO22_15630 [Phycisphaerae bacterium]|nr:hypothetical protein [Phycisphaerae bacterium]
MTNDPYHMRRPDLPEAKAAVERLYGQTSRTVWQGLLAKAVLTGHETAPEAVERLARTMMADDSALALCGRSLLIRLKTHEYLLAAAAAVTKAR